MTKKVKIFGTGSALKDFLSVLPDDIEIVGIGDNNLALHNTEIAGHKVMSVDAFAIAEADICIIAGRAVDAIRGQLITLGVNPAQIAAYYPSYSNTLNESVNRDISLLNSVVGLRIPKAQVSTMYLWPDTLALTTVSSTMDFVRSQTIKLAAEQINARNISGSIAELGVYQGELAAMLNQLFPARILHLFDTFAGFADKNISGEKSGQYSTAAVGDFAETSADLVMSKMIYPDQVVIHKGFFPESVAGFDDQFALVSLDVDLFEPSLAGLEWFYPRLTRGGMIFVHDYNNRRYSGVRHAVNKFVAETGAAMLPLPDFAGSVVILK